MYKNECMFAFLLTKNGGTDNMKVLSYVKYHEGFIERSVLWQMREKS